jgi:outer membrane biogenesis lipoprotein LolB
MNYYGIQKPFKRGIIRNADYIKSNNSKMKNFIILFFLFLFLSCKKDSGNSGNTVEYEVTATNTSIQMVVAYNNNLGQYVSGLYQSGWTASFTPAQKPFTASLQVSPYIGSTTATLKILVNGTVVQTVTGPIDASSPQLHIQYVVQ